MSPPPPGAQSRDVVPEQSLQGFVALEVVPQVVTCLCLDVRLLPVRCFDARRNIGNMKSVSHQTGLDLELTLGW